MIPGPQTPRWYVPVENRTGYRVKTAQLEDVKLNLTLMFPSPFLHFPGTDLLYCMIWNNYPGQEENKEFICSREMERIEGLLKTDKFLVG